MIYDIVGIFRDYATAKGWEFAYGARKFLNAETTRATLTSGEEMLYMLPFRERGTFNDAGNLYDFDISTQLWLGRKFDTDSTQKTESELDETEDQKNTRRLLALRADVRTLLNEIFCKGDYNLKAVNMDKELNFSNENLDFVIAEITFSEHYD